MFIPVRTDNPLRRTPYMNWGLIVANIVAFAAQQYFYPANKRNPLLLDPRDPHVYQFFTYAFLHGNFLHLAGNMLFLFVFGNNVNDKMGNAGYLGFYLAGAVFSGVSHVMFESHPVLGASGAVAAVTGAYLVLLPRSHVTIIYWFIIIGSYELSGMWFVLAFFVLDLVEQFSGPIFGGRQSVAHMAHIGGTAFGFVVCLVLLWVRLLPRDMFDILAIMDRWNRRRQHRDAVSRGYDPFGYSPRVAKREPPNPMMERIQDVRASISAAIAHQNMPEAVRLYMELHTIDANQVLSRQSQLDIANQLFSQQIYPAAAEAYELYLRSYPKADQLENVQLMLGIIYARYLQQYDKAKQSLETALAKLHAPRDIELAKSELGRIQQHLSNPV
jgi:membrane associated rhomboid family serine protease